MPKVIVEIGCGDHGEAEVHRVSKDNYDWDWCAHYEVDENLVLAQEAAKAAYDAAYDAYFKACSAVRKAGKLVKKPGEASNAR
jgi:hypothetical protein